MVPQPSGYWVLDRSNELAKRLLLASFFTADDQTHPFDYVNGQLATDVTDVTANISSGASRGVSSSFNGTTSQALFSLNLGGKTKVTVSFWLNWADNATVNLQAFTYGSDLFADNGFFVAPNNSIGLGGPPYHYSWIVGSPSNHFALSFGDQFPTGEWHHHIISFDRDDGVKGTGTNYVDGQDYAGTGANDTFANGTPFGTDKGLAVMYYRGAGGPLRGNGQLQCLAIFDGHLSQLEATELYTNTYQLVKPVDRPSFDVSPVVRQPIVWQSP